MRTRERRASWTVTARAILALGLLALLLSDVWRVPHLLLERHRVCSEHGELVHGHGEAEAVPARGRSRVASFAAGETAAHSHEHCSVVASLGKTPQAVHAGRALPRAPRVASVHLVVVVPSVAKVHADLLAVAPKQGPPARA